MAHGGNRGNQHTGGKRSNDLLATQRPTMTINQAADAMDVSVPTVVRAKKRLREDPAALAATACPRR